jgi:DNA-binding response OmpR family regulator
MEELRPGRFAANQGNHTAAESVSNYNEGTLRALIVEDEPRLAENIARALRESIGYAVDIASDGEEGLYLATSEEYDLMLLDLMLPKLDGHELLTRYRKRGYATPVLVLTARFEKESVVRLLNAGADDYLAKPFDLGELLARAKALVRRGKGQRSPVISVADLHIDTIELTVRRGHREIALAPMEYRVLEYLAHRSRAVVSKTELLEHLYDYDWEKFSNVIEVYISGLRRKIDDGHTMKLIHTVRGHGYALRAEREHSRELAEKA